MAFWLRRLCFNLCRKGPYAKALCSSSILGPTQGSRFLENDPPMFSVFNPAVAVSRHFSSRTDLNNVEGPVAFDYSSILSEAEFHGLADETLHNVQEKLEECGDDIQIDGFDMDYASGVLTLKLGNLGTYVINKQTPNRQIWLSSPVSGPARFDWDSENKAWIYRRTKVNLLRLLENELGSLLNTTITFD